MNGSSSSWLPDLVYRGGEFQRGLCVSSSSDGRITEISPETNNPTLLANRALLPGLVNTHSHAFQRVIRGRTEHRTSTSSDSFWTWREMMYSAANRLTPEDIYDASRMAFLEMALTGITTVGEFHYIHHGLDGKPYSDPDLLAKEVVRAALDVGLRIALLRVAYARAGFQKEPNPLQIRFIEDDPETYLRRVSELRSFFSAEQANVWLGVAPHSVRGVPLSYLKQVVSFANEQKLPVHMHVAEQPEEVVACIEEYGRSPVSLLQGENLLNENFTLVHAIHLSSQEIDAVAKAKANVCACPTTERNLGDGVIPADAYFAAGVPVCLGSDSQAQIDLLEDARELEYHLRLQKLERSILAPPDTTRSGLAARLFECATSQGARSLDFKGGYIERGYPADFFTVDLEDPSIAGSSKEGLLPGIVFSLSRTAVREVVVGGRMIVQNGRHKDQGAIVEKFEALQKRLWD